LLILKVSLVTDCRQVSCSDKSFSASNLCCFCLFRTQIVNITRLTAANTHNNIVTLTVAKMTSYNITVKSLDSSTTVSSVLLEGDIEMIELSVEGYIDEGTVNTVCGGKEDEGIGIWDWVVVMTSSYRWGRDEHTYIDRHRHTQTHN